MGRAIVTDARYRMALAAVRSLGRAGVGVTALEEPSLPASHVLAFHSRYTLQRERAPSPRTEADRFAERLAELGRDHDAVLPVSLAALQAISERADDLQEHIRFLVPTPEHLRIANDTGELLRAAERVGVPMPATAALQEGETVEALADRVPLPAVVKYRAGELLALPPAARYAIVRTREEFVAVYARMHARQPRPLAQEYIPGAGFGVSALYDRNARPVAWFAHRRLREYPVSGGPSCFCESVLDDELVRLALSLLDDLKWQGIAMVEFKQDAVGRHRLMEINPRLWGSLALPIAAGVDFPYLWYRASLGEAVRTPEYRAGVRMRFLLQDLLAFPGYLKRSERPLRFALGFLGDLLNPRVVDGVFRLSDPKPGLYYGLRAAKGVLARGGDLATG